MAVVAATNIFVLVDIGFLRSHFHFNCNYATKWRRSVTSVFALNPVQLRRLHKRTVRPSCPAELPQVRSAGQSGSIPASARHTPATERLAQKEGFRYLLKGKDLRRAAPCVLGGRATNAGRRNRFGIGSQGGFGCIQLSPFTVMAVDAALSLLLPQTAL